MRLFNLPGDTFTDEGRTFDLSELFDLAVSAAPITPPTPPPSPQPTTVVAGGGGGGIGNWGWMHGTDTHKRKKRYKEIERDERWVTKLVAEQQAIEDEMDGAMLMYFYA